MIDGKRSRYDLEKTLNQDVGQIVVDLERMGYIYNPQNPNSVPPAASKPPQPTVVRTIEPPAQKPIEADQTAAKPEDGHLDSGKLSSIKIILAISTKEHLGIMGRSMLQRIEAVENYDQLKSCISHWHMAIRESKTGKVSAPVLMEEVNQLL